MDVRTDFQMIFASLLLSLSGLFPCTFGNVRQVHPSNFQIDTAEMLRRHGLHANVP